MKQHTTYRMQKLLTHNQLVNIVFFKKSNGLFLFFLSLVFAFNFIIRGNTAQDASPTFSSLGTEVFKVSVRTGT